MNELVFSIYKATCLLNGKCYIGVTKYNYLVRKAHHEWCARTNRGSLFHKALRKYGTHNFVWEVLAQTNTQEKAFNLEITLIKQYSSYGISGYNLTEGGGHPGNANLGKKHTAKSKHNMRMAHLGYKMPEAQKIKISNANKGRRVSAEGIKRMSQAKKGRIVSPHTRKLLSIAQKGRKRGPLSEETRKKMSQAQKGSKHTQKTKDYLSKINKGKKLSEETKKRMSLALKGRVLSEEAKLKNSGLNCHFSKGLVHTPAGVFESQKLAALKHNCNQSTVGNRCRSKRLKWSLWYQGENNED